jgi:Uncharacterized protein conserved in bacteria
MDNISTHITYAEGTKSQTAIRLGIENEPDAAQLASMKRVASKVFEPVRRDVAKGNPLAVTSFFRSPDVNTAVGGSFNSQHCAGEAMDIDADVFGYCTNASVFEYIRDNLEFDKLIWEYGTDVNPEWVHVSLKKTGNRRQVSRAYKRNNKTYYEQIKN